MRSGIRLAVMGFMLSGATVHARTEAATKVAAVESWQLPRGPGADKCLKRMLSLMLDPDTRNEARSFDFQMGGGWGNNPQMVNYMKVCMDSLASRYGDPKQTDLKQVAGIRSDLLKLYGAPKLSDSDRSRIRDVLIKLGQSEMVIERVDSGFPTPAST